MTHHPFDLKPLTAAFAEAASGQLRHYDTQWRAPDGSALQDPEQAATTWLDEFSAGLAVDRRERFEQRHRPKPGDLLASAKQFLRGQP